MPVRLIVSKRTLEQGKIEFKLRRDTQADLVTPNDALARIAALR